jgi:hypothetical protein
MFTVEGEDGGAPTRNSSVGAISHTNPKVMDDAIGDKRRFVGIHVVRGARIGDDEGVFTGRGCEIRRDGVLGRILEEP